MQTRRDHLQAYQFAMGRLATALVTGDPGRGTSPTRRGSVGTFFGAVLVVLLCAGFGVYGLVKPVQKDTWRQPGTIIVEKETGTRYLLVGGTLRPVRNYASALLLTGSHGTVRTVSRDVLAEVPHGSDIGIPGAPDSLPAPQDVASGGWTRCLRPDLKAGQVLDLTPGRLTAVPADRQVVLADPKGRRYVLWRGTKYPVPSSNTLIALGLDANESVPAPADWLDQVPTGVALAAPAIPHTGARARSVAGKQVRVGQVFRTSGGAGARTYVLLDDGIAPVNHTQAALLAAAKGAAPAVTVDASALASAPVSRHPAAATGLPDVLNAPAVPLGRAAVCVRQQTSGVRLTNSVVLESGPVATGRSAVVVAPAHGLLVLDQDEMRAGVPSPQTYLVTDQGTLFPFGDSQAAGTLRLSGPGTAMPAQILHLLPRGPVLGKTAATATLKG
ncbi:type VII secretion protein EccB [Streptomyces sp. NPDC002520]